MKTTSMLLFAAVMMLSSCAITARQASSSDGQMFQDGIYSNTPSFRTKAEKQESQAEVTALTQKTKESEIYLFGDKKDTVMIPENFYAKIQFDQKVGGTTVTVGEYPYITDYGYYYGPYSIGSSWYWSRHYSPFYGSYYSPYFSAYYNPYWSAFSYNPWRYHSYYDPWYYDPWYHNPWYAGSYWGWHDPWHHYHHHCGWYDPPHHTKPGGPGKPGHHDRPDNRWYGMRAETGSGPAHSSSISRASTGGTTRGGASIGNRTGRASSGSRSQTVYRKPTGTSSQQASSSSTAYRRPASTGSATTTTVRTEKQQPTFSSGGSRTGSSSYSRSSSSSSYNRSSSSSGSSSYSRSSSSSGSSSYSRGSSSSGSSSYSRGSSSYRR